MALSRRKFIEGSKSGSDSAKLDAGASVTEVARAFEIKPESAASVAEANSATAQATRFGGRETTLG